MTPRFRHLPNTYIAFAFSLTMLLLTAWGDDVFNVLCLRRESVEHGEWWRLLTGNFVHFGWAHTLMNTAAFVLCSLALFNQVQTGRYLFMLLFCCMAVGVNVFLFNPEYQTYAGLSGAIHGIIVAGLLLNKKHSTWVNTLLISILFLKVFYEHMPNYQANDLQQLLPVAVAFDAHLYGAIAGAIFGLACLVIDNFFAGKNTI